MDGSISIAFSICRRKCARNPDEGKDPAAVALGRKGGLKGGKGRAKKLSPERLSEIGRKAAKARWEKDKENKAPQDEGQPSPTVEVAGNVVKETKQVSDQVPEAPEVPEVPVSSCCSCF